MNHPRKIPSLVFADKKGTVIDFPDLAMAGMSNGQYFKPELNDIIPLPEGSEIFLLPQRLPVGLDFNSDEPLLLDCDPYSGETGIQAVAAFMAPAHTTIFSSAYQTPTKSVSPLPLFAYSAVGWLDDRFWVAGFRSDPDIRQDAEQFDQHEINLKTKRRLNKNRDNRLIQHLGKCCLTYCCPAARNLFLERWEAPLPTSPNCNARCVGCISLQPSGCCPSTQDRITFIPTADEISEIAVQHIENAEKPIVSFGQGCEGEPLLQGELLEKAIGKIRSTTPDGTINLNSNASKPAVIKKLAQKGLDSLRVSLNSAQEKYYIPYYRPVNYSFSDVLQSISVMKEHHRFVSLNYFILPGITDSIEEYDALCGLIEKLSPDLIQLRNLNMDPEWYFQTISFPPQSTGIGIRKWKESLAREFPTLQFGYFNPYLG